MIEPKSSLLEPVSEKLHSYGICLREKIKAAVDLIGGANEGGGRIVHTFTTCIGVGRVHWAGTGGVMGWLNFPPISVRWVCRGARLSIDP